MTFSADFFSAGLTLAGALLIAFLVEPIFIKGIGPDTSKYARGWRAACVTILLSGSLLSVGYTADLVPAPVAGTVLCSGLLLSVLPVLIRLLTDAAEGERADSHEFHLVTFGCGAALLLTSGYLLWQAGTA